MSIDFQIACNKRIHRDVWDKLIEEFGYHVLLGDIESKYCSFGNDKNMAITCDLSDIEETDEAWETFSKIILLPKYYYKLSLPMSSSKARITNIKRFTVRVAEVMEGAAIDPQTDKIIFPKGRRTRYKANLSEDRTNVIVMTWFLTYDQFKESDIRRFLQLAETYLPEAVPIRYGYLEPFSYSCRDGKGIQPTTEQIESFIQFLIKQKEKENTVYWSAERPVFSGNIFFPFKNFAINHESLLCTNISLSIDARACEQNNSWIKLIEKLFIHVADELPVFYAMCYVNENIGVSKHGTLWLNGRERVYPFPAYHWWMGIPGYPVWMSWFGKVYENELNDMVHQTPFQRTNSGWYVNTGLDRPMTMEEAELAFPKLPQKLLTYRNYGLKPDGSPSQYIYEDIPAEVIPTICE